MFEFFKVKIWNGKRKSDKTMLHKIYSCSKSDLKIYFINICLSTDNIALDLYSKFQAFTHDHFLKSVWSLHMHVL